MELNKWVAVYGIILQILCGVLNCLEPNMAENCVLSFVVPKESIKSNCNAEQKFTKKIQSLENMVRVLRQHVSHLQARVANTHSHNQIRNDDDSEQKILNLEERFQILETKMANILNSNKESDNPNNTSELFVFQNLIKPYIEKQVKKIGKDIINNARKASQRRQSRSHTNLLNQPSHQNIFGSSSTRRYNDKTQSGRKDVKFATTEEYDNSLDELSEESGEGFLPVDSTLGEAVAQSMNTVSGQDHSEIQKQKQMEGITNATIESITSTLWNHLQTNVKSLLQDHTMKANERMANYMSITESKQKHLLNIMAHIQRNYLMELKTIEIIFNSTRNEINEQIDNVRTHMQGLVTTVDVFQNKIKSFAGNRFDTETVQPELQNYIKKTMSTAITFITSKMETQKHKITKLDRFAEIFRQTLQHYNNHSRNFEEEINQRLNYSYNRLQLQIGNITHTLIQMNNTKSDDSDFQLQEVGKKLHELQTAAFDTQEEMRDLHERINSDYYLFQTRMDKLKSENKYIVENQTSISATVTDIIQGFKKIDAQMKLDANGWTEYNFSYIGHNSECFGKHYISRKKGGPTTKLVGVILCSADKYKIVLGETLESNFQDLGDQHGFGEDHCEFVGASSEDRVEVGQSNMHMDSAQGYRRRNWGQDVHVGMLSFLTPCPPWYKCDVTIP